MTLNIKKAFKLKIHHTKHPKHTNSFFQRNQIVKNQYLSKNRHSFESAFSAHLYDQAGIYFLNSFRCFFFKLLSDIIFCFIDVSI